MTAIDIIAPEIVVNGAILPDVWRDSVTSLRVEKSLCLIGRATLRFADLGYQLSGSNKFGLGTDVKIGIQGKSTVLLAGAVTGVSLEQNVSSTPELVVTIDDYGYKLALGTTVATYLESTFLDVLTKISSLAGLQVDSTSTNMKGTKHDYLLQSGSNLAYLNMMCERAGSVWCVEDRRLRILDVGTDGGTAVELKLSETLSEFSVRASALRPTGVVVKGWDAKAQQDVAGQSGAAASVATSEFVGDYVGNKPEKLYRSTQSTFDMNPKDSGEAGSMATALYNDIASSAIIAKGMSLVEPAIKLMTRVKVTGAGPASGSYVVSQVEHVYRSDGFYTRFVAGPIRPGSLVDTLGPAAPDPGFEIGGLLTAVVTNVQDPDKIGRVKVRYAASGDLVESTWARVVGLGVGKARGSMFQPEINDEVLIGFERGDSRYPVVLGGLYSAKNTLPQSANPSGDSKIPARSITSRLGHVIELSDGTAPAEQHLLLKLADDKGKLRLGADRFDIEVPAGHPILIKAGSAKFEIDAQGNVVIEGTKITLKAQTQVSVEGAAGVEVKSNASVAVKGSMVDVKADGIANVEASGMLNLKGGVVKIN